MPLSPRCPKYDQLASTRHHGKRCCGAHAVLCSVHASTLPKEPALLEAHVLALEARLRKKGIGTDPGMIAVPKQFSSVLSQLKRPARRRRQMPALLRAPAPRAPQPV